MAARWEMPDPVTPTYKVFKMYRNYDGEPLRDVRGPERRRLRPQSRPGLGVRGEAAPATAALTMMAISKVTLTGNTPRDRVPCRLRRRRDRPRSGSLTAANTIERLSDMHVRRQRTHHHPASPEHHALRRPALGPPPAQPLHRRRHASPRGRRARPSRPSRSPSPQPAGPDRDRQPHATADGTATAGSDYVVTNGTLIFPPGTTTPDRGRPGLRGPGLRGRRDVHREPLRGHRGHHRRRARARRRSRTTIPPGLSVADVRVNEGGVGLLHRHPGPRPTPPRR